MKIWQLKDSKTYSLLDNNIGNSTDSSANCPTVALPSAGEIKVKLSKVSIASTDISAYLGRFNKFPIVPARSAVALISESTIESYKTGQRIYLSPYSSSHNGNYRLRSVDIDGYLADYCYIPVTDIYSLPDGISDDEAIFIEDIALAIKTLETLNVEKAEYIALYGASYINIIIAQLAIYYQTVPVIIDNDEDRLITAQNLGIYYTINMREEVVNQKVIEITSGKLFDHLVFDGDSFSNIDDLLLSIKQGGNAAIIGYNPYIKPINCNLAVITSHELRIFGVNNGDGELSSSINMLANKIVKIKGLIELRGTFNAFSDFMKLLTDGVHYGKAVVDY